MTYNSKNIPLFMSGWTVENKTRLYAKMQKLGISKGGIFSTDTQNIALFDYLVKDLIKHPVSNAVIELIKARELVSSLCEYIDDHCNDEKSRMLSDNCTDFLNSSFEVVQS